MCLDTTLALSYLQERNLYHLDVKPHNILYDDINTNFLISDFGTSIFYYDKSGEKQFTLKSFTRLYCSPEVLDHYDNASRLTNPVKCDIFSLGLTFLHSYLGFTNFLNLKGLNEKIDGIVKVI